MTLVTTATTQSEDDQKDLTPNQARAVASLLKGLNRADAARDAGVSLSSVKRWLAEPAFKAAIAEGRKAAVDEVVNKLSAGLTVSLGHLFTMIDDPETPSSVRVRGIEIALNNFAKFTEISAMNDRIAHLELSVYAKQPQ